MFIIDYHIVDGHKGLDVVVAAVLYLLLPLSIKFEIRSVTGSIEIF